MYLCHADEGLVEVFDRLRGILRRLVSDVANAPRGKIPHIGNWKLCKVFPDVFLCEFRRETTHEDARGIHGGGEERELRTARDFVVRQRERR